MEFPFGQNRRHNDEEDEDYRGERPHPQHHHGRPDYETPPPRPEYYNRGYDRPDMYPPPGMNPGYAEPPPPSHHSHSPFHHHHDEGVGVVLQHESRPGYDSYPGAPPPPRPAPYDYNPQPPSYDHHPHQPPYGRHAGGAPGYSHSGGSIPRPRLPQGQVCRVFCKANPHFSLSVHSDKVVLARSNPEDDLQHWIKDETYSTRIKDERGYPSFALVNKATGLALKHGLGESQPVLLSEYRPDAHDEAILWSMSEDMGEGYRTLRQVNDIKLNCDAFHGDKKSGGIHDGTPVVLWKWKKGDNQLWQVVPYCKQPKKHYFLIIS